MIRRACPEDVTARGVNQNDSSALLLAQSFCGTKESAPKLPVQSVITSMPTEESEALLLQADTPRNGSGIKCTGCAGPHERDEEVEKDLELPRLQTHSTCEISRADC